MPIAKQLKMMEVILILYHKSKEVVAANIPIARVLESGLFDKLVKIKYDIPNDKLEMFDDYKKDIEEQFAKITANA